MPFHFCGDEAAALLAAIPALALAWGWIRGKLFRKGNVRV